MLTLGNNCQVELPGVMTFSGNDRLIVFSDADGSQGFDAGDQVMDAFGQIATPPAFELWSNLVLRRCNPARFDGSKFFPYKDYFTVHSRHDHVDFGKAPTATTCP
jgi:hypothetical protein